MKSVFLALSFLLVSANIHAQEYKLVHTVSCSADASFTTDPIGNFYIYIKGDITKFNSDGIETARYSSREYGDISYVDATNSLKVLVVFKEFSKAILLDAALSPQATMDLSFPGIPYVNFICTSRESGDTVQPGAAVVTARWPRISSKSALARPSSIAVRCLGNQGR